MKTLMEQHSGGKVVAGPGSALGAADRSIGALLIDAGKISPEDAERILRYSREKQIRFGDAAVGLRLVKEEDIAQVLAQQFSYPYLQAGESSVSQEVVAAWRPFSREVEVLRAVRSQLLLRWFVADRSSNALAIASAGSKEGRSYVAANLAVVFSQLGERTLLIDADLRTPAQHSLFGLENDRGLSTVLAERAGLEVLHRVPGFVDLSVLPAGPLPPNPLELLGRAPFDRLLSEACAQFDVVLLDTPALEQGSDVQVIAQKARGVLVVARLNTTRADQLQELTDGIGAAAARIVGTLATEY